MKTNLNPGAAFFGLVASASLVLASCSPKTSPVSTEAPTSTTIVTRIPTFAPTPTATPLSLPAFSLQPGQFYFSMDGQPGLFYSRNVAVINPTEFWTLMDWSVAGGTRMIRFGLANYIGMGGWPFTSTGELNEPVIKNWENVIDAAAAHGLFICPWFSGVGDRVGDSSEWAGNPFNAANGGPVQNPTDIFQEGTTANTLWFDYVTRLVTRWKDRPNILCWEVLGEANAIKNITEQQGIAFAEKMARVIHAADPHQRPITASLVDEGPSWPNFFASPAIDIIQTHPYPDSRKLDRTLVDFVHRLLARYHKPVLTGESGFNANPMTSPDWITASPRAPIGVEHAIWAGVVSGMMNGRGLFWEDAYGVYFRPLRYVWLNKYAEAELPTFRFTSGVDFTDFKPLNVLYPNGSKVWGASVGNDHMVLGWFRDAASEPPDWNLLPNISGQTVTIVIPGSAKDWQVDFYNTKTGNALGGSTLLTRQGDHVTIAMPDFTDDVAFKLFVNTSGGVIAPPTPAPLPTIVALTSTDPLAGQWEGTSYAETSDFGAVMNVTIQPGCEVGSICGKIATDWCFIDLVLNQINGNTLVFEEKNVSGTSTCPAGGVDKLTLQTDGTILLRFEPEPSGTSVSNGILHSGQSPKMSVITATPPAPTPSLATSAGATPISVNNTDPIAGKWSGTISNAAGTFTTPVKLTIQAGCAQGNTCGIYNAPQMGCAGDLFLQNINGENFLFQEQNVTGGSSCKAGGYEQLQLNSDGSLTYQYLASPGYPAISTGTLKHP